MWTTCIWNDCPACYLSRCPANSIGRCVMTDIVCAGVMDWARDYDGPKFHALLCDPSYVMSQKKKIDLGAMADLPDDPTLADVIAAYHSIQQWGDTGFMGKAWDDDVAFDPKTWAVTKDGGTFVSISGATISSRAITKATMLGLGFFRDNLGKIAGSEGGDKVPTDSQPVVGDSVQVSTGGDSTTVDDSAETKENNGGQE